MRLRWMLVGVLVALATLPAQAVATYPGGNGKIAFVRGGKVLTMDPDGSNQAIFADGSDPAWTADGKKLAWVCPTAGAAICTQNADGTDPHTVNPSGFVSSRSSPTWSPDERFLMVGAHFPCFQCTPEDKIERLSYDGTDEVYFQDGFTPDWSLDGEWIAYSTLDGQVTKVSKRNSEAYPFASGGDPNWSPDNTLAFVSSRDGNAEIYVMDEWGFSPTRVTSNPASDVDPEWSPGGDKILFASNRDGDYDIYSMNADGSGVTQLTNDPADERKPDQQTIRSYIVRPKGATPTRVPLVPAFSQCTSPNRQHGAPLAFGSCSEPVYRGRVATIGSKSVGSVVLKVMTGTSADVRIDASLTDVRLASDPAEDMEGSLDFAIPVRISDYDNARSHLGPGTVVDLTYMSSPMHVGLPCATTAADTAVGSTCSVSTTVNAVLPNPDLTPGVRSVWELGQLAVYDGGQDVRPETYGDNTPVAVQGVFVP